MARPELAPSLSAALALALAFAVGGCGKKDDAGAVAPPAAPEPVQLVPPPAPAGATGSIKGSVVFTGEVPALPKLRRDADPFCAKTEMVDETIVVNANGTLANVVVRIEPGSVAAAAPPPAEPAVLVQDNCMYRPRVQGVMAGQQVVIKNPDQTTHNVHAFELDAAGAEATLFNLAQPKGAGDIRKDTAGYHVMKFKCDVHPWMVGYIVVTDHPHFATTGDDGSFLLENVPVGNHTVQAWHEHYGVRTAEVTVEKGATAELTFTYDGGEKKGG
jgi:plastocyanin